MPNFLKRKNPEGGWPWRCWPCKKFCSGRGTLDVADAAWLDEGSLQFLRVYACSAANPSALQDEDVNMNDFPSQGSELDAVEYLVDDYDRHVPTSATERDYPGIEVPLYDVACQSVLVLPPSIADTTAIPGGQSIDRADDGALIFPSHTSPPSVFQIQDLLSHDPVGDASSYTDASDVLKEKFHVPCATKDGSIVSPLAPPQSFLGLQSPSDMSPSSGGRICVRNSASSTFVEDGSHLANRLTTSSSPLDAEPVTPRPAVKVDQTALEGFVVLSPVAPSLLSCSLENATPSDMDCPSGCDPRPTVSNAASYNLMEEESGLYSSQEYHGGSVHGSDVDESAREDHIPDVAEVPTSADDGSLVLPPLLNNEPTLPRYIPAEIPQFIAPPTTPKHDLSDARNSPVFIDVTTSPPATFEFAVNSQLFPASDVAGQPFVTLPSLASFVEVDTTRNHSSNNVDDMMEGTSVSDPNHSLPVSVTEDNSIELPPLPLSPPSPQFRLFAFPMGSPPALSIRSLA
ncbi:hypothetical protein CVT26_009210, partial [Gymnopilus dilepis]